jgi:glycosyltransferase involved in cell wall biosynthesis
LLRFSIVIPTFSRTDEVVELLKSLEDQTFQFFEVIIADGSPDDSVRKVIENNGSRLTIKYLYEKGLGISESRNLGVANAQGEYIVFFDSDCVIPTQYFSVVDEFLLRHAADAWGGPDRAHESFNNKQKAISYAMTSFFTTGGIRGRRKHAGHYQPRSFNMGIRRDVFNELGGFSGIKVSEDIDLSLRLYAHGYQVALIGEAFVYHKRRSTFYKFFRQVFSFGSGRIDLQLRNGNALKWVHLMPSFFVLYILTGILLTFLYYPLFLLWMVSLLIYSMAILLDSSLQNHSMLVGFMSIYASFVMLTGYGTGMIKTAISRGLFKSKKEVEKPEITKGS